ncbi:MAG: VOC family protein [Acidimicrobiia bacterium]
MATFHPYLFFGGTCREAFTRYQEIFGGELFVMTMSDVPDEEPPAGMEDVVIHAAITGGDLLLMGSDEMTGAEFGPVQGMQVAVQCGDVPEANRVFTALSEGGTVEQELVATFFSPAFGMVKDRFGTPWMITTDQPDAA